MSIDWIKSDWPAPDNIHAGTTLRRGGVSRGGWASLNLGEHCNDVSAAVTENRRRFSLDCDLPSEPHWLSQTHGCNVATSTPSRPDPGTDAMVTRAANSVCAVLTADCLPVVFATHSGDEVGVAHAGWRGLCDGILEATISAMHTPPEDILAWLGPAISQAAFEVGAEVREQFVKHTSEAASYFTENERGRFQADLYGLARQRLAMFGVGSVYGGNRCTYTEKGDFFSYRREGECGRMATFVYRSESA